MVYKKEEDVPFKGPSTISNLLFTTRVSEFVICITISRVRNTQRNGPRPEPKGRIRAYIGPDPRAFKEYQTANFFRANLFSGSPSCPFLPQSLTSPPPSPESWEVLVGSDRCRPSAKCSEEEEIFWGIFWKAARWENRGFRVRFCFLARQFSNRGIKYWTGVLTT